MTRKDHAATLRRRAESRLRSKAPPVPLEQRSPAEVAHLIQELRVQQTELELQNDELQRVQSALHASREELALSDQRYRQLYETAPVAHLTLDADGRIENANPAASALLGPEPRALVGRRFSDFVAPEHQDAWHRHRRALARGHAPQSQPLDLQSAGDVTAHVELASFALREGGQLVGVHVALLDVTERRRMERQRLETQRLPFLTDALPVLLAFVDREERCTFVNTACEAWLGRPPAAVRGRTMRDVLDVETYALLGPHVARALAGAPESFEGDVPYPRPGRRYVSIAYSPDVGEDGAVRGIYVTILDLTALRRAREALRAAAAEAALGEARERRKLAADLHDDVGQILSLASLRLRALADATSAPEQDKLLQGVRALVSTARERVSTLSFRLSPPVLHDVGLVAAAEWLADEMKTSYQLEVQISAPHELEELDDAKRVTLFRALRELLINVARHAGCGEASVRIARVGGETEIEVEDGGGGFAAEAPTGGFGLRSLREGVEHIGGTVCIDSAPGRGTKVRVRVPIQNDAPARQNGR